MKSDLDILKACAEALDQSTSRKMLIANLEFLMDRYVWHPSPELPESLTQTTKQPAMNEKFEVGDIVEWESQSRGHYGKVKRGEVVQLVICGSTPNLNKSALRTIGAGFGGSRKHDSYLVNVDGVAYWPRVKHLRVVKSKMKTQ